MQKAVLLLPLFSWAVRRAISFDCHLYLSSSLLDNAGRGVFSGELYQPNQLIELSPAVFVRYENIKSSILENYVFSTSNDDYGMILLGLASLFNHAYPSNAEHFSYGAFNDDPLGQSRSLTAKYTCSILAVRFIQAFEEIFLDYGSEWLSSHLSATPHQFEILRLPPPRVFDQRSAICLTTVDISESSRFAANQGVFAEKDFSSGELITVSPVLLLPWDNVALSKETSQLMNYCYQSDHFSPAFALLPLTHISMINHFRSILFDWTCIDPPKSCTQFVHLDEQTANVRLEWFDWDSYQACLRHNRNFTSQQCLQDQRIHRVPTFRPSLNSPELAWKTNEGYSQLTFALYASKIITKSEELLLDYGEGWENSYNQFLRNSFNNEELRFRAAIPLPAHMAPAFPS